MMDRQSWLFKWEIVIILLAPFALLTWLLLAERSASRTELEIVAHREDVPPDFWTLNGRVRQDGNDVPGAKVWLIVKARQGDRDSPPIAVTGSDGQFTFTNLRKRIGGKDVQSIEIYAKVMRDGRELKGLEILQSGDTSVLGTTGPPTVIGGLAIMLLLSMGLSFVSTPGRIIYVVSMILAVAFNFGVIYGVGYAMYKVHSTGTEGVMPALGYISVFRGTYVERGPEQWLISLSDKERVPVNPTAAVIGSGSATLAGTSPDASTPIQGFGAPLWVLLLAVVGSGILTVSLVTQEIREPPAETSEKIREKIYKAVQHQVYTLFSPICAIFIYQTMVITKTAGQPLVVALATLGAGTGLNVLLKNAVEQATGLLTRRPPSTKTPPSTEIAPSTERAAPTENAPAPSHLEAAAGKRS